jgi:F0F1-type ATP synthase membrane subunit b/b'
MFSFEQLLATKLINFAIMFWLLSLIWKKCKLGDKLAQLAENTKKKIEESRQRVLEATSAREKAEAEAREVPKIQEKIAKDAKDAAIAVERNIHHECKACEGELDMGLREAIKSRGAKMKKQTLDKIYNTCLILAQEEIVKNLDDETQKHLLEAGIDEISRMEKICL